MSQRSGLDGRMFGAEIVQAAVGNCLDICVVQKRNGRVLIHFHTNSTSLYSNQGKILSNIKTQLNIDELYLCFWEWYPKMFPSNPRITPFIPSYTQYRISALTYLPILYWVPICGTNNRLLIIFNFNSFIIKLTYVLSVAFH